MEIGCRRHIRIQIVWDCLCKTFAIRFKIIATRHHIIRLYSLTIELSWRLSVCVMEKSAHFFFHFLRARLEKYPPLNSWVCSFARSLFINLIRFVYIEIFSLIIFVAQPLRLKLIQIKMSFSLFSFIFPSYSHRLRQNRK